MLELVASLLLLFTVLTVRIEAQSEEKLFSDKKYSADVVRAVDDNGNRCWFSSKMERPSLWQRSP
jgi:hypothetical protein